MHTGHVESVSSIEYLLPYCLLRVRNSLPVLVVAGNLSGTLSCPKAQNTFCTPSNPTMQKVRREPSVNKKASTFLG